MCGNGQPSVATKDKVPYCTNALDTCYESHSHNLDRKLCHEKFRTCTEDSDDRECACPPGMGIPCKTDRCGLTRQDVRDSLLDKFASNRDDIGRCPFCSDGIFAVNTLADCFTCPNINSLVDHMNTAHPTKSDMARLKDTSNLPKKRSTATQNDNDDDETNDDEDDDVVDDMDNDDGDYDDGDYK